ncbi:MAG: chemotaxis protein CheW [Polyangiaceae bacterium]|nr:chemotaxis protein CheW [Polyangiaceae bacterium]
MRQPSKDRPDPKRSLVGFALGDVEYAVPISSVREIVNALPTTPVPNAPDVILGVADHRGDVVPVVDLRARLGMPKLASALRTKWILVDVQGRTVGLAVDRVTEVFGTEGGVLRPAPEFGPGDEVRGISGVAAHGGKLIFVLDLDSFESLMSGLFAGSKADGGHA